VIDESRDKVRLSCKTDDEQKTNNKPTTNMKTTIEKSDADLKNDILSELKFEPNVRTTDIGVLVDHGTVTLNGFATS